MKRTVVYFTDSPGFGGAEQALLSLMAGLDRECWQPVLMYHASPGVAPLVEGATRLGVELCPVPRMPDGLTGARRVRAFTRELRARHIDVFHAHLTWPLACKFGLVGAILARIPAIVATVQLYLDFPLDLSRLIQQRLIYARSGRYIAVSHHVARCLQHKLHWPADKIQVIHNSVTLPDLSAEPALQIESTPAPSVLTIARLDEQKGHAYLLEAAAQLPQARFVLAGDGPLRSALEAQVRSLGLEQRVKFLGYRTDILDLLARCDVVVLPSLYEGLPLSILEAMAAGKPVVATRIGGTDEAVIPGETGLLVPPADATALATAIRTLLDDRALAQRMGVAGRARVAQEFSTKTMVKHTTDVYAELLAKHEVAHGRR